MLERSMSVLRRAKQVRHELKAWSKAYTGACSVCGLAHCKLAHRALRTVTASTAGCQCQPGTCSLAGFGSACQASQLLWRKGKDDDALPVTRMLTLLVGAAGAVAVVPHESVRLTWVKVTSCLRQYQSVQRSTWPAQSGHARRHYPHKEHDLVL